ncbi:MULTISPECIES: four-helix bundle copper-binding protein [Asticcacaulis]|uniref:four-helix bundle copper-binding protein n=1 Tax=Asticcacaulis TaxID=76890 RepID=UPI001AE5ACF5|nr:MULTISPECIES: four-helix bundle copper-binding protein [Asticcacaulis]MBP2159016.1 hypothetical protein [Asticcacaulis solisilvae]MDR6800061.1 hypothetical protein [Asticcacaulis sp. BE141]
MPHDTEPMTQCIALCWECRDECQTALFDHCLTMGGDHVAKHHVTAMTDCIQVCQTAADAMTRQSPIHAAVCAACAEACEACAKSCEQIGDTQMQKCAEVCRRCAQSCREMSKTMEMA